MDNLQTQFNEQIGLLQPKLDFPKDGLSDGLDDVWDVYKPSFYTQALDSEQHRNVYAEEFELGAGKVADKDGEPTVVPTLRIILLKTMLANYKGGPLGEQVLPFDASWIGQRIDIEMPVEDTVDLDSEVYWKRVALAKCRNPLRLTQSQLQPNFRWKRLAIESKLMDIFDFTDRVQWKDEKINDICQAVSPYVLQLDINQLQAIEDVHLERNRYNRQYRIFNYPPKDCHHGNFGAAIGQLANLRSLRISFGIKYLHSKYHQRYFEMSYEDIEALANGLSQLHQLERLAIVDSRLDDRKCKILIRGLLETPLDTLDLSNCHLGNDAGKALAYFLMNNTTCALKSLELKSNRIGPVGWQAIAFGVQNYAGRLEYLGMSGNPVGEAGVVALGGGICDLEQIERLDLMRAEIAGEGVFRLVQLVGFHKRLRWLDLSTVWFGKRLGDLLVQALQDQWELEHLAVWHCGLTENQERKLRLITERNIFYKKNPCMRKDTFTIDDAKEIDDWVIQIKNPIYNNVILNEKSPYDEYGMTAKVSGARIPSFIEPSQRVVASNSELLDTYYIDCFGTDAKRDLYDPAKHNERAEEGLSLSDDEVFEYEPNKYENVQFSEEVIVGTYADLTTPQYFA